MADNLKTKQDLIKAQERYQTLLDLQAKTGKDFTASLDKQREKVVALAKELKKVNQERLDALKSEESSIKSISSSFQTFSELQKKTLSIGASVATENKEQVKAVTDVLNTTRDIASISKDDEFARMALTNQYNEQLSAAKLQFGEESDIIKAMQAQFDEAISLSKLSEEEKKILESQAAAYDTIKTKVASIGATFTTFLNRPQALVGALVAGVGTLANKFGEVNRELGQSFLQGLNKSTMSATALGFIFDDTAGTVRELASEFGGVDAATLGTQTNIGLMATNMGISNKEAVSLTASFARMNGGSTDIAADMVKTTQEFANQNGIIPSALMQDLAGATEEFALFGKDGGENILRAAGYAQKLGVSMKTMSGIAEGLLDFESSITKELELGAMLGKNINLDRARALAFEGDIEGATKETLNALGGIEAFNKMDYFQKKATADLLGVSVAELQKMADNQKNANTLGAVMNENFSKAGEFINAGLNKYLGTGLQGLGGMITMAGELGTGFKAMGIDVGKIAGNIADGAKNLMSKGWQMLTGGAGGGVASSVTESISEKATDAIGGGGAPGGGIMEGMSKINMNAVLKGAAAMVIVAGAVFVFGKAVQEFMQVSWEAVGMAVVSMLALVGAVALLGTIMTSPMGAVAILAGAAAMLVIAASVLVLGYALQEIGTGFEMMASGIGTLMPQLMSVATTIAGLVVLIPAIALLSYSLMGLSASLMALGVAGIVAAPGLMALGAVGAIATGLNSLFGGGGEEGAEGDDTSQLLIDEIRGLRTDLNSGKIAVYMDGEKVTSRISATVERVGGNSYAMS